MRKKDNCSSIGRFHRLQAFRNRLLLLVSPRGQCFCQEPAPVGAFDGLQLPSGHVHLLRYGALHGLKCGYLLWHGPFHGLQGLRVSLGSSPRAAEGHLLHLGLLHGLQENLCFGAWSISYPSFSDVGVCRVVYLTLFLTLLSHNSLTMFFTLS